MSDAHSIPRFSAPPAAPPAIRAEGEGIARGLVNGVLLAVPLWALIGLAVSALI